MKVAGEEGDVSQETLSSWDERSRELMRGYESRNVWNIDETGQFWRALPDKSLSERGKRCRSGKNSKERATWAFFVSASGEKEGPIVVGKSRNPRYFKSLKDSSRPYKCDYFSSSKAWMTSEIFEEIILRLDRRMKREDRHILLFLDNATCHPNALIDRFSNIKMAFLPKNTTSRTQPLDAGIIKLWKVKTKRKLLRYVCSKIDGQKTASDIVKSVNLLMAIQWGKQAWDEINQDTIAKCFNKVGLVPDANIVEGNDDYDPFEGEDMLSLEELCKKLGEESSAAKEFVNADEDLSSCTEPIDTDKPSWREDVRNDILEDTISDPDGPSSKSSRNVDQEICYDDEGVDSLLKEPTVKSVTHALQMTEELSEFANSHGNEELSNTLLKVSDILRDLKIREPQKQTRIDSYFLPT